MYVYAGSCGEEYAVANDIPFQYLESENISLDVMSSFGVELTEGYTVNWYEKGIDTVIATGNILRNIDSSKEYMYEIILDDELGLVYREPGISDADQSSIVCTLERFDKEQLSVKILDENGNAAEGASVTISQNVNGRIPYEASDTTSEDGTFDIEIYAGLNKKITVSKNGYYDNTVILAQDESLENIQLVKLPDTKISLSLTQVSSVSDGDMPISTALTDFSGLEFKVYNKTKGTEITSFTVQYPDIIIDSLQAEAGDDIEIQIFRDGKQISSASAVMGDSAAASVSAEIRQNGKFTVSSITGSENVSVMVFDGSSKFVKAYDAKSSMTSDPMPDGEYKVLFIKQTVMLQKLSDLTMLDEFGLVENTDYVIRDVAIESGHITVIETVDVPNFDETKLYYTDPENTYYLSSKSSAAQGRLVTMTAKYSIKEEYNASAQTLIFDIPEGTQFIEGSLTLDGELAMYSIENGRLSIITNSRSAAVRFYVAGETEGEHNLSAYLSFDLDGESITQPIGTAYFNVENMTLNVPEKTSVKTVPISGTAVPKSRIEIYCDDELIGETESNSNGTWSAEIELQDKYRLAMHRIYIKAETRYGFTVTSSTKNLWYDPSAAQVSKVTMVNGGNRIVFDFLNPSKSAANYTPSYSSFTFMIEFTGQVDDVILYVYTQGGKTIKCNAEYDEAKDIWIAVPEITDVRNNSPVSVGVDYLNMEPLILSGDEIDDFEKEYNEHIKEIEDQEKELEEIYNDTEDLSEQIEKAEEEGDTEKSFTLWTTLVKRNKDYAKALGMEIDTSEFDEEAVKNMTTEEWVDYTETLSIKYEEAVDRAAEAADEADKRLKDFETKMETLGGKPGEVTTKSASGLTPEGLMADGYEPIDAERGGERDTIYVKNTDTSAGYVDFSKDTAVEITYDDVPEFVTGDYGDASVAAANGKIVVEIADQTIAYIRAMERLAINDLEWVKSCSDSAWQASMDALEYEDYLAQSYSARTSLEGRIPDEYWNKTAKAKRQYNNAYKEWRQTQPKLSAATTKAARFSKIPAQILKLGGPILALAAIIIEIMDYNDRIDRLRGLLEDCPDSSEVDSLERDISRVINNINIYLTGNVVVSLLCLAGGATGIGAVASFVIGAGQVVAGQQFQRQVEGDYNDLRERAQQLECIPDDEPFDEGDPIMYVGPNCNINWDPSGYVCEAVPSNRIEGVTTTAYYEGDELDDFGEPTGNKIPYVWDASDYDQVNPLITDANGEYAWDVPQGQWQVKYEKEGYETAYSEWLPVPPPQMEVHVALVSTANPEVKSVNAYTTRLRIEFSRYMDIGSVNTDNVTVTVDGVPVSGTITPLNSESSFDDPSVEYASIFTFVPDNEISGKAVVAINNVVAYNGKALTEAYSTTVPVEYEPQSIEVQETASVAYSGETLITLQILPAEAGANKDIIITSSSPSIVSVSAETVTTDENGNAAFAVNGNLPGSGEISFALEGTDITAATSVTVGSVSQGSTEACQKVTASIASGTEVERGTELTLSTATDGAEIYYTLDRTCPCIVDNPSRTKYTGPIEINEDMYIVAYAVKDGFEDSATAAFSYTVESETVQPSGGGGSGSARRYTVTFDTQGGSTIDSVSVFSYNTLNEPTAPVREGYSFDGWYTDQECTEPYDFSTRVTHNITLYAKWTPESEEPSATAEPEDSTFDDVSESDWFYEYVEYAYDNGLMTGVSENEFAPDTAITRGMFVTVLHRMENEPAAEKAKFDDVDDGAYYADAVAWASENGIVEGFSAEEFRPDQSITREQMAVIIYRYADFKGHDMSGGAELAYSDTESISEYARTAVEWIAAASIMQGNDDNTFAPQGTTTRAQAAAVFVRLLNIN